MFKEVHLVPQPVLTKHIAMISRDNENVIIQMSDLFDSADNLANLAVEIGYIGIIGMAGVAHLIIRHSDSAGFNAVHQTA